MQLQTKLFLQIFVGPSLVLAGFLYFIMTTFVAYKTADVFESQMQLLGSSGIYLDKTESKDLPAKAKALLSLSGNENLVLLDKSWIGHHAKDVFGPGLVERLSGKNLQEESFEISGKNNETLLVSFLIVDLVFDRYTLMIFKPKAAALRPTILFTYKIIAAMVALLGLFIFSANFLSSQIAREEK
jgi:hypothetical protein